MFYLLLLAGWLNNQHPAQNFEHSGANFAMNGHFFTQNELDSLPDSLLLEAIQTQTVDLIEVSATRLGDESPIPHTTLNKKQLQANNVGLDLPFLLEQTPSVVVNSDAGAGLGYTGIRIRGTDATRINVTINGIPVNDAESQGVFWVNMPDLVSGAEDVQIQRGAGTSTNGAGAFGASINIRLNRLKTAAFGQTSHSVGSFGARKHNVLFGTGLINGKFSLEGRLSKINSDGYIDRASANLSAYSLTAAFVHKNTLIRANLFGGKEITYQAWGGVPIQYIDTNRTYNPYTYKDEVDNYRQTNAQLHFNHSFNPKWAANLSLHYTKGAGYFEQYKTGQSFSRYGLQNVQIDSVEITETDLIRRRWLDNDFYGAVASVSYQDNEQGLVLGGGANQYKGAHFGEVIWAQYMSNGQIGHRYYDNDAVKNDANIYAKYNRTLAEKLNLFADMQLRAVSYDFLGYNQNLENVQQSANLLFFNPKLGANYRLDGKSRVYFSFSVANKEPNRDDYTQSSPSSRPKAERLHDYELGYQLGTEKFGFAANGYFMDYKNQLVLTGKLNDVGANIRQNVAKSYRAGLELQGFWLPLQKLRLEANLTLSQNKILNLTEFVDVWDDGSQARVDFAKTDIAFSPNIIGSSTVSYQLFKTQPAETGKFAHDANLAWISKYVGKQFLDNTSSELRQLDAYWLNDLRVSYRLESENRYLEFSFLAKNVLNKLYSSNGWTYRYISAGYNPIADDPYSSAGATAGAYQQIGLFPQAGFNWFLSVTAGF